MDGFIEHMCYYKQEENHNKTDVNVKSGMDLLNTCVIINKKEITKKTDVVNVNSGMDLLNTCVIINKKEITTKQM